MSGLSDTGGDRSGIPVVEEVPMSVNAPAVSEDHRVEVACSSELWVDSGGRVRCSAHLSAYGSGDWDRVESSETGCDCVCGC